MFSLPRVRLLRTSRGSRAASTVRCGAAALDEGGLPARGAGRLWEGVFAPGVVASVLLCVWQPHRGPPLARVCARPAGTQERDGPRLEGFDAGTDALSERRWAAGGRWRTWALRCLAGGSRCVPTNPAHKRSRHGPAFVLGRCPALAEADATRVSWKIVRGDPCGARPFFIRGFFVSFRINLVVCTLAAIVGHVRLAGWRCEGELRLPETPPHAKARNTTRYASASASAVD
ncbi:dispersed gene family protein 1 (DGF-1), putative [Trypanosoma cruzi]|nr:dispersed gene family protein 1 (DGF-1), putative [Trypanosoma cruzi]